MARTARAAIEDLLTCERCHAFYYVERAEDGARTRMRCSSCGHTREVWLTDVTTGQWTVIDPEGKVSSFGTWEDLSRGRPASEITVQNKPAEPAERVEAAVHEEPTRDVPDVAPGPEAEADEGRKSLTGSALLDITPSPKLALVESVPDVPATAGEKLEAVIPSERSIEELDPDAVEMMPDSRDAPAVAPPPAEDEGEPLSLRDLVVVPGDADNIAEHLSSTPPPPKAGELRTLPPPKLDAPPPPTITVDDGVPALTPEEIAADARKIDEAERAKAKTSTKAKAASTEAEPKASTKAKATPKPKDAEAKAKAKDDEAEKEEEEERDEDEAPKAKSSKAPAKASAVSQVAPKEEEKRGWVVPALAIVAAGAVVWRLMSAGPSSTDTPPAPTATPTATTPTNDTPTTSPTATDTTPPPDTTATNDTPTPSPTDTAATTATAKPRPKPTAEGTPTAATGDKPSAPSSEPKGSMSDLLDQAGAAKRSGDFAKARDLYQRVLKMSPSNVEANGGLGDVARAQGDLAGAKASYERALAVSPSYGPAALGLADVEWDMGNKSSAQRHYYDIVVRMGARAPERARQRASLGTQPAQPTQPEAPSE